MANITKIELSDGSVYGIFDVGALRLNSNGQLITGNTLVDSMILEGCLTIKTIDDVPVGQYISNVLVQDQATGLVKKRSTDLLLKDIGGISCSMDDATNTLSLKLGK